MIGSGVKGFPRADRFTLTHPYYDFIGGPIKNPLGRALRVPRLAAGQRTHFGIIASQSLFCSSCTGSTGTSGNQYVATESLNENFNIYDGGIYASVNPLLGCGAGISYTGEAGKGGNIMTMVGDKLIAGDHCDRSIVGTIGINATAIQNWCRSTDGDQKERIRIAFERAAMTEIPVTYFLWSQGTSNAGNSQAVYQPWMEEIIGEVRKYYAGPILINRETYLSGVTNAGVRAAQAAVVNSGLKIYAGVDMDVYTTANECRQLDDIHINALGANYIADDFVTRMTAVATPTTI